MQDGNGYSVYYKRGDVSQKKYHNELVFRKYLASLFKYEFLADVRIKHTTLRVWVWVLLVWESLLHGSVNAKPETLLCENYFHLRYK